MKSTQKPIVIKNPSPKLLEFVRGLEQKKAETKKQLRSQRDLYFPKKNKKGI